MNFHSVILSDHLVLGLENRAFREGFISEQDFAFSERVRPRLAKFTLAEQQATDMLCLYDQVWSEEKRFSLNALNRVAGENIVRSRPLLVRPISDSYEHDGMSEHDWVQSLRQRLDGRAEFDALREQAEVEAQILVRRDINWHIADAQACFEGQAPRQGELEFLYDLDLPHAAVAEFLRRNVFWLIDFFQGYFGGGDYNNFIDADVLEAAKLPKELVRQFRFFSRSARFDAYFQHLQECYSSLFENSFFGRLQGLDLAYDYPPDRTRESDDRPDIATLSRVIRINLADVIDYFPLPRTLEEAFEFRGHPRVTTFRSALSGWLLSVATDGQLELKLRQELTLASRDLTRLKQWRTLKEHPIFFGVKTALSIVPVVGFAATGVDLVDYFYERYLKKRTAWVVNPRSRLA